MRTVTKNAPMKLETETCSHCQGTGQVYAIGTTGPALKSMREGAGVGLREMARRLEVSPSYLSKMENCPHRCPVVRVNQYIAECGAEAEAK